MSKIENGGLDQYGKCKALAGSAVKGLTHTTIHDIQGLARAKSTTMTLAS